MEKKKTKKIVLLVVFAVVFCVSIFGFSIAKSLVMLKQNINLDQLNQSKLNNNKKQTNKYVIIVGASQVTRMNWYYKNTKKTVIAKRCEGKALPQISTKYIKDKNLFFIDKGGSGISNQIGVYDGSLGDIKIEKKASGKTKKEKEEDLNNLKLYDRLIAKVEDLLKKNKNNNIELHIFFPLAGNTIKYFTCDGRGQEEFKISKDNKIIKSYVKGYYDAIMNLKQKAGKNNKVYGYVSSMHPDVPMERGDNKFVVNNNNANACEKNYRSNEKYYKFNLAVKANVKQIDQTEEILRYESLLTQIMKIDDPNSNYSYKVPYCTTDGVHWDQYTTIDWVNRMIKASGRL